MNGIKCMYVVEICQMHWLKFDWNWNSNRKLRIGFLMACAVQYICVLKHLLLNVHTQSSLCKKTKDIFFDQRYSCDTEINVYYMSFVQLYHLMDRTLRKKKKKNTQKESSTSNGVTERSCYRYTSTFTWSLKIHKDMKVKFWIMCL